MSTVKGTYKTSKKAFKVPKLTKPQVPGQGGVWGLSKAGAVKAKKSFAKKFNKK